MAGINLQLEPDVLRPLIAEIVAETVARLETARPALAGDKLAYSEAEAARMLDLGEHVLRDERRRGRIAASSIVGRRIRYTRADLMDYLARRRWAPNAE